MKFRFFSDVHLEKDTVQVKRPSIADVWIPQEHADDASTTLILAGDIWNGIKPLQFAGKSWMKALAQRFKFVVVVLGNHDYWGENVDHLCTKWRQVIAKEGLTNVNLLELADGIEHGSVVLDGVRIVGGTFWTDMHKGDPNVRTKFDFEQGFDGRPVWNDQNFIRAAGYSKFTASHWLRKHRKTIENFRVAIQGSQAPTLLVTHHAPCMLSAKMRDNDKLSSYLYGSDLSDLILDHPCITQAIHGHTHEVHDYFMGDVSIRCNPRGYSNSALVDDFDRHSFGEIG